jgi:hypothetical protein
MRRTVAILLLACFGILVPLSASPVRVCFLDADAAAGSLMIGQNAGKDCCDGCTRESETPDPCCLDVEELPDSTPPQSSFELPPVVLTDLTELPGSLALREEIPSEVFSPSEPIRGPTSPSAFRAVLGIWRL